MLLSVEQGASAPRDVFPMSEQFAKTVRANLEAQLSILTALSTQAVKSMEQVIDLSMKATKDSVQDSATAARQLLAVKNPQELVVLAAAQMQATTDKAVAFSRDLARIAADAQVEMMRTAEEQVTETGRKASALAGEVSTLGPAESANAAAMMKSAIDNANASYEQFSKTARQAIEAMRGLNAPVVQFARAAEKMSPAASVQMSPAASVRVRKH